MLKNKLWIVALLVALTMAFFGCTNLGLQDDGSKPVDSNLPEVVVEGADIVLTKVGSGGGSSGTTVDGNKFKLVASGATQTGFSIPFPAEVKGKVYKEIVVEMEVLAITSPDFISFNAKDDASLSTDVLIVGHTQIYHNELKLGTVVDKAVSAACSDDDCLQYTPGTCVVGAKGKAAYPYEKFAKDLIAFQYNPWAGDITTPGWTSSAGSADFEVAVTKVTFVPYAGAPPAPVLPPTFGGDATKVVYTKTGTPEVEKIEDSDPLITGPLGMAVSADGYFTFDKGGMIHYKFPASATGFTGDPKIGDDWDKIEVQYLLKDIVTGKDASGNTVASAVNAKVQWMQFEKADSATGGFGWGSYANYDNSLPDTGTVAAPSIKNLDVRAGQGSGGFSIRLADYDLATGGGDKSCADSFSIKILKVIFTKVTRYTVQFYTPDTPNLNNIADVEIPSGEGLQIDLKTLSNPGWVFLGWFNAWSVNSTTDIGEVPSSATQYTATTAITGDTKLYAKWLKTMLANVSSTAATDGTLFGAVGSYSSSTTYTYPSAPATGGKDYWIIVNGRPAASYNWTGKLADFPQADFDAIQTQSGDDGTNGTSGPDYTRLAIELSTVSANWNKYTRVTVTYDAIPVGGANSNIQFRNSNTAAGGSGIFDVNGASGTDKTATFNIPSSGWIGLVKNGDGVLLMRITKVELHY